MRAKEWYKLNKDGLAYDLVHRREAGESWSSLEARYGLDPNNGMSAIRVYKWRAGSPKAFKPTRPKVYSISLDAEAERNLKKAKEVLGVKHNSRAIRIVLEKWLSKR